MNIKEFYIDKNIFITGSTGFIGNVLLESLVNKLNVNHIYCLYRKNILEKYKNHKKITWIKGDILYTNFCIEENILLELYKKVNIIFHLAAYTRWDISLKDQIINNTDSTIKMMKFSKKCINLNIILFTSSYWASCNLKDDKPVEENIIQDFKALEEYRNIISKNSNERLLEWPNAYAYSKNLTERILDEKYKNHPVLVARVVSVGPALKFPYHGFSYINNSLPSFIRGIKSGATYFPNYILESINDTVPVDTLVNMLIINVAYKSNQKLDIINCSTGDINPFKLKYIHELLHMKLFANYEETENAILNMVNKKKSNINKIILQAYNFALETKYIFKSNKTRHLFEKLNDYEKQEFDIDIKNIDWKLYIKSTLLNYNSNL